MLALFVPLIISSGGNSGSQATSLLIRSLALREVSLRDWWKVCAREIFLGVTLGAVLGAIGFLRIVLWAGMRLTDYRPHYFLLAITVWLSLIGMVGFGTIVGSMLPFLLRRCGFDPATSSSQPVATLIDVTGLITISQPHVWCFAACCCENRAEGKKEIRANHCWSSSSPGTKRYPTHGSVRMYLRELTSCSSFLRSWPMKTRR